jgi:ribonuclease P protein component
MAPNDLPHNRYGFITTRKLGNAVARNRAKRRLREAARFWHPRLTPGHDVVFIARQGVNDRLFTELIDAMEVLFRRADLL